ncbi:MAG TPA: hypothetical protein VHE12_05340 [bacterium]|nr:hypothetical protein [bacterium]
MTETEAEKVLSIFAGLLKELQTTVFLVSGEVDERLILRKTLPAYFALCSWPTGAVSGFFPYSLALEGEAMGCRHSIGITPTDLYVCLAAPDRSALHKALDCIRRTNDLFLAPEVEEPPRLQVWLKGYNERLVEIADYQGEDPAQLDLD